MSRDTLTIIAQFLFLFAIGVMNATLYYVFFDGQSPVPLIVSIVITLFAATLAGLALRNTLNRNK